MKKNIICFWRNTRIPKEIDCLLLCSQIGSYLFATLPLYWLNLDLSQKQVISETEFDSHTFKGEPSHLWRDTALRTPQIRQKPGALLYKDRFNFQRIPQALVWCLALLFAHRNGILVQPGASASSLVVGACKPLWFFAHGSCLRPFQREPLGLFISRNKTSVQSTSQETPHEA